MIRPSIIQTVSCIFCLLAGAYIWGSVDLPRGSLTHPGAGFYPLFLGLVFLSLGFAFFLKSCLSGSKTEESGEDFPARKDRQRVLYLALVLIAFAVLLKPLGYGISSGFLMISVLRILGMKNWLKISGIAVITSGLSYYFFTSVLGVPLPEGAILS